MGATDRALGHAPLRTCLVCRGKTLKKELLRYVCEAAAEPARLIADPEQKLPGRGFYVCGRESCRERFEKACRGRLRKAADKAADAGRR